MEGLEMTDLPELEQDWYFTFGFDHAHPNGYRKVYGTYESARAQMVAWYGNKWAFQYGSEFPEKAERYGWEEVKS
jgi:hypothetical protein